MSEEPVVQSRHGTQSTLEGEIIRSSAIKKAPGTSEEDSYASKAPGHSEREAAKLDPPTGNFLPRW